MAAIILGLGRWELDAGVLSFDGTSGFVSAAHQADLNATSNYTFEAWVYPTGFPANGGIVSKKHSTGSTGPVLRLGNTSPYTAINFDNVQTANGVLASNTWYHVAAVNSNGLRRVYINGALVTTTNTAQTVVANTDPLTIGVDNLTTPAYFKGYLDDVRIWNVVRTQPQILAARTNALAGNESGLVAYYRFDEGYGMFANDRLGLHPGVLMNAATWAPTVTAPISYPTNALVVTDGLRWPDLVWTNLGNVGWLVQTNGGHDGRFTASSGTGLIDGQTSGIQTAVTGPGSLSWYWQVSSELNFDFLNFLLDGGVQNRISGTATWGPATFSIPAGLHGIAFHYTKDGSVSAGSDMGWVDQVVYTGVPVFTTEPADLMVLPGQTPRFAVGVEGGTMAFQWQKNATNIVGATNASYAIPTVTTNAIGSYRVIAYNAYGTNTSSAATLSVVTKPAILSQPQSLVVSKTQPASFSVSAMGPGTLIYQWQRYGTNLAGATNTTFTVASAQATNAGDYRVVITNTYGATTSLVATLTVYVDPVITGQPQALTRNRGETATFNVTATGGGLGYFWMKDGVPIAGANASSYSITNCQGDHAGTYSVLVSNAVATATSTNAELTVIVPPVITQQPANTAALIGTSASFSVAASGLALNYQWYLNNIAIAGATGTNLVLNNLQGSQAGNYKVVVTNTAGRATSSIAVLTVLNPPRFLQGPDSVFARVDDTITLRVNAVSVGAQTYQWYHKGDLIPGATNSSYSISHASRADMGDYRVLVRNPQSSAFSPYAFVVLGSVAENFIAWGDATSGQGTFGAQWTNLAVIAGGGSHTLALRGDGVVLAAGSDAAGQSSVPSALGPWVAMAAGANHSLAVRTNATVVAWGDNSSGQTNVPAGLSNVVAVAAGDAHSLALRGDGTVAAWGGVSADVVAIPEAATNVVAIAATASYSVAVRADGLPIVWGDGMDGVEVIPVGATNIVAVAAGAGHILARRADGTLVAWGDNTYGQTDIPAGAESAASIAAGAYHNLALLASGDVLVWGAGSTNQADPWPHYAQSTAPAELGRSITVAGGAFFSLACVAQAPEISGLASRIGFAPGTNMVLRPTVTGSRPMTYQWSRNGSHLAGQTNATISLGVLGLDSNAVYSLTVSNMAGTASSGDISLEVECKPVLTGSLVATNLAEGASLALGMQAAGTLPITFRWYRDAELIDTTSTCDLALSDLSVAQSGAYSVVASNLFGTTTVGPAQIVVYQPVTITLEPTAGTVIRGAAVTLVTEVQGTTPIWYQWARNGSPINGATNAYYRPPTAQLSDSGSFTVTATNRYSSATSTAAVLNLMDPPAISDNYTNQSAYFGQELTLSVTPAGSGPFEYRWFLDGSLLDVPDASTLTIDTPSHLDDGVYSVEISNAVGTIRRTVSTLHVVSPPYLLVDLDDALVPAGRDVNFFVRAGGEAPLSYTWYRDGLPLVDEFATNFVVSGVSSSSTNSTFFVVVTNAYGAVTSSVVRISIVDPPTITSEPVSIIAEAGAEARFTVGATGEVVRRPKVVLWDFSTNPAGQFQAYTVDSRNGYAFGGVWNSPEGCYTLLPGAGQRSTLLVFPESDPGERLSEFRLEARLRLRRVADSPAADGISFSLASLSDTVIGDAYHLGFLDENAPSRTASNTAEGGTRSGLTVGLDVYDSGDADESGLHAALNGDVLGRTELASGALLKSSWQSLVITMLSSPDLPDTQRILNVSLDGVVRLSVTNTWVPARSVLVVAGRSGNLPADVAIDDLKLTTMVPAMPLQYQWYWNGVSLPGATNAVLVIPAVTSARQGTYEVTVSNLGGQVTSEAAELSAQVAPLAVGITPPRTNASPGSTVTLSATAAGTSPFWFQWHFNGVAIEGQTNQTLVLSNLPPEAAGFYTFSVSNTYGAALVASPAEVRVVDLPFIESGPDDVVALRGQPATLAVSVRGTGPFRYQWMLNGEPIENANGAEYTIPSPTAVSVGNYSVAVANLEGSVMSSLAHLRFASLPKILRQPTNSVVPPGGLAEFTVAVESEIPVRYQWQQNGTAIPGETNQALTVTLPLSIVAWDYSYSVIVSSDAGWVASKTARLLVHRDTQPIPGGSTSVQQVFRLEPGWNAIYLTVQPASNAVEAVFAGVPWTSVWHWKDRDDAVEFIQDVSEARWNEPDWLVHFQTNRVEAFQNNLARVFAGQAYLVHIDEGAQASRLEIVGEPSHAPRPWRPDCYNFTGLPLAPGTNPATKDYFQYSSAHYDSFADAIKPIFRLAADGHWVQLSNTDTLKAGEAYWFYVRGGSTYRGPVEVSLPYGRGLSFSREVDTIPVTLINRTKSSRRVQLTAHPAYPGAFPLMVRSVSEQGAGFMEFPLRYDVDLGPSESRIITLSADRLRVPAEGFKSVMFLSDDQGLGVQLPVVIEHRVAATETGGRVRPAMTGLWVGQATFDAVSEVNSVTVLTNRLRWTNELGQVTNAVVLSYTNTPSENATPTPGGFNQRIMFHIDSEGTVRLVREVYQLLRNGTTRVDTDGRLVQDKPADFVLVTHRARIPEFVGTRFRDGEMAGRRISCPTFPFEGEAGTNNFVVCTGEFSPGAVLSASFGISADHPLNPFKHKFHPDHDNLAADFKSYQEEARGVFRELTLVFDTQAGGSKPDSGYSELKGEYRERFRGLHKQPIVATGRFALRRISTVGELNPPGQQ